MRITFVTVGKFKSREAETLAQYYLKLISKFTEISIETFKPKENLEKSIFEWLEKRGNRTYLTLLDEKGECFSSLAFSKHVEKIQGKSLTEWIILCGSEHGYSEQLRRRAHGLWSLSPLTFPHELASVIALEQLFRAYSILNGTSYHNE